MKKEDFENLDLTPIMDYGPLVGVTAAVVIDIRRKKDDGYYPVKYRVTYDRKQDYYPAMDLTLQEFSDLHKQTKNPNLIKTKKLIKARFTHITGLIDDIVSKEPFELSKLAKRLSRGTEDHVLNAFDNRIADLNKQGKIGSVVWYTSAKNSIEKFTKHDITFSMVTPEWLRKYEKHLLDIGNEYTTISINMRAIRAICNIAKSSGVISEMQYPFEVKRNGKYKIPEATGTKRALSEAQLYNVFDYPLTAADAKYRDLWIFSFYCAGVNIGDMLRFKWENISGNTIEWYRKKTISTDSKKIKIRAIITDEMRDIINKWGNTDKRPGAYIFDYLRPKLTPLEERKIIQNLIHTINKKMTKIGRALGYGDITTYFARHTWASISRRNDVSLFAISKSLGHKNLSTTQIYLDSLSDDELAENAAKMPRLNR
jgi:integrase